jgi:hypothetical protein
MGPKALGEPPAPHLARPGQKLLGTDRDQRAWSMSLGDHRQPGAPLEGTSTRIVRRLASRERGRLTQVTSRPNLEPL